MAQLLTRLLSAGAAPRAELVQFLLDKPPTPQLSYQLMTQLMDALDTILDGRMAAGGGEAGAAAPSGGQGGGGGGEQLAQGSGGGEQLAQGSGGGGGGGGGSGLSVHASGAEVDDLLDSLLPEGAGRVAATLPAEGRG
jgi:hypothetical protein